MSIRITCPSCDKSYNVDDSLQGKKLLCRECKSPIVVSASSRRNRDDEDDRPARDDRISSSRSASASGRPRRDDDDDEPRRRPAERSRDRDRDRDRDDEPRRDRRLDGSRYDEDDSPKSNSMPIIIGVCVGAVALLGAGIGGAYFIFAGNSGPSPAPVASASVTADAGPGGAAGGEGGGAAAVGGDVPKEIAKTMVDQVKKSTAYLRVNLPNGGVAQGSGFFALEHGLVITNAHVLGMLRADSLRPRNVDVVVYSGEANETKMTGTVLGIDRDNDLAVLRVEGDASRLPAPLPVESASKLGETQKVYIFGFPFGAALGKSITVSDSAVTSLRRDGNGILKQVQVNGGMNPGNSGGPVTDARGVVVGVSVAGIPGTNINFAIPGDFVQQVVNGKVTNTEIGFAYRSASQTRLPVRLGCLDPMNRIREVKVDVWTGPAGSPLSASSTAPANRPGDGPRQSYTLAIKDGGYSGEVVLPSALAGQVVWIQPMALSGNGTQWDKSVEVPADSQNPVERRAATIQFKVPANPIERTLKMNNHTIVTIYKGADTVSIDENLGAEAVEFLKPPPKSGEFTPILLVIGNCPYTQRIGDTVKQAAPQANEILRRYTASWTVNAGNALQGYTFSKFTNLSGQYREIVMEMYGTIRNTFEQTTLPLPNSSKSPGETWPTKMPFAVIRNGKSTKMDIELTCTFEGVLTVNGRSQACVSLKGRVKGRGALAKVELGKVTGSAHVDIDGGFVSRVKLTTLTELENEDKGARMLVQDTCNLERTEGNSLGLTPPPPPPSGTLAKNNPPDKTKPDRPARGGSLKDDLAALKGAWQSDTFKAGTATAKITLNFTPSNTNQTGGRVRIEITAQQRGGAATQSTTVNFTLRQSGDGRQIVARGVKRAGLEASYELKDNQLILTGSAGIPGLSLPMTRAAFRRAGAGGDPGADAPQAGGSVLSSSNKLPDELRSIVQAAVVENRLGEGEIRGFGLGTKFRQVHDDGGVLIGMQFGLGVFGEIGSIRPIYLTTKGEVFGSWQGKVPDAPTSVKAKSGYALSGMAIKSTTGINGFTITFARLGKGGLDMKDTYTTAWFGKEEGTQATIGGSGDLVVGIVGRHGRGRDQTPCALGVVSVQGKK
jgi:S1-C subfamily serine protease